MAVIDEAQTTLIDKKLVEIDERGSFYIGTKDTENPQLHSMK